MRKGLAALLLLLAVLRPGSAAACGGMFSNSSSSSWAREVERTPEPLKLYRALSTRVDFGGNFAVTPLEVPRFTLDLVAGGFITWVRGFGWDKTSIWMIPEAGYSLRHDPDAPNRSLATLGLGVGYGSLDLALVSYMPRFVVGRQGDDTVLGLRHGLSGFFLAAILHAELSHQLLRTPSGLAHEILFSLGLNPATFFTGI